MGGGGGKYLFHACVLRIRVTKVRKTYSRLIFRNFVFRNFVLLKLFSDAEISISCQILQHKNKILTKGFRNVMKRNPLEYRGYV